MKRLIVFLCRLLLNTLFAIRTIFSQVSYLVTLKTKTIIFASASSRGGLSTTLLTLLVKGGRTAFRAARLFVANRPCVDVGLGNWCIRMRLIIVPSFCILCVRSVYSYCIVDETLNIFSWHTITTGIHQDFFFRISSLRPDTHRSILSLREIGDLVI